MTKIVKFAFERETPGALRYAEVDEQGHPIKGDQQGALIGSLYLRKAAMEGKAPKQVSITLNI